MCVTLENKIVFITLNNKYIIKCICFDELISFDEQVYDSIYASYYCNKVLFIEIYDNNKNSIIYSITVPEYEYSLTKGSIINLGRFDKNKKFKKNIYFKTFVRAYMNINKINDIKFDIKYNGDIYSFRNNIIKFNNNFTDMLKSKEFNFSAMFFDHGKFKYYLYRNNECLNINYYLYNNLYDYYYYENNYYNIIRISRITKEMKENAFYEQSIICDKDLKILQILEYDLEKILYEENRDNNGKIISIKKYNYKTNKLDIAYFNDNNISLLIRYKKDFCQGLLNFYNLNIKHDLHKLISLKDKELIKAKEVLLNLNIKCDLHKLISLKNKELFKAKELLLNGI